MNSPTPTKTHWPAIWGLFIAGCTLALHIGKLAAALPLVVEEFSLSLAQSGNLVSIYSLLIFLLAVVAGLSVARVGYVPFAIAGVALGVFGSFAGARADTLFVLMFSRTCEGLGWILAVVSIPVLLGSLCCERDRPLVLAIWGAFMGVGTSFVLLISPSILSVSGWRLLWLVAAALSLIGTFLVAFICYQQRQHMVHLKSNKAKIIVADFRSKPALALCCVFCLYSIQYTSVISYLPTVLSEDSNMKLSNATYWTAALVLTNAIGNVAAGWLLRHGITRLRILSMAFIVAGVLSLIVLSASNPVLRIVAAFPFTLIGGLIPGTLFAAAPLIASSVSGVGAMIGFMLMGAGLGQTLGPIAVTRIVEWFGDWLAGGVFLFVTSIAGAFIAVWLRQLPRETE